MDKSETYFEIIKHFKEREQIDAQIKKFAEEYSKVESRSLSHRIFLPDELMFELINREGQYVIRISWVQQASYSEGIETTNLDIPLKYVLDPNWKEQYKADREEARQKQKALNAEAEKERKKKCEEYEEKEFLRLQRKYGGKV